MNQDSVRRHRMDIFYYWQKLEQNLKNGEVGYFGSNNTKILEL
ncbi:hypothetical protein [Paraburkholderia sp. 32]